MKPRILLLCAYAAASHQLWSSRLQRLFPEYAWTSLTLPPRHFNWTIRGNSLLWAFTEQQILQQPWDVLIATSMVDLSSLRGFVPALTRIPTLVYFHENQFAYPQDAHRADNVEPQLVPLYAALCADRIVFNSQFNRSTFLQGANDLFRRLPDAIPAAVIRRLEDSCVIPVPVPTPVAERAPRLAANILEVVWNHRWEYDKGIDLLLALCREMHASRLPVRLHIVGEQFRQHPQEFQQINVLLQEHAACLQMARGQFGYITGRANYEQLLANCDVVLSTARHDFQGLAIQEACMQGCTPLTPNALVYPEYLSEPFLYELADTPRASAMTIAAKLQRWQADRSEGKALPQADLTAYGESAVYPHYAKIIQEMCAIQMY